MQQAGAKTQKCADLAANARSLRPGEPVVKAGVKLQMHHAIGQGRRHAVRDGLVLLPIAGGYDRPAIRQAVFANGSVEYELVTGCLNQRRSGVEFVQKQDARGRVARPWQKGRRAPYSGSSISKARQAAQVNRVKQHGPDVPQGHSPHGGHLGYYLAFAHARRTPQKYGLMNVGEGLQSGNNL